MRLPEHVRNLTPEEIDCIIDDFRLLDAGYRLNICIDPYEIFDFCIPVNPESPEARDIDVIADDQASLYHVFFNWGRNPILVPEYRTELDRLIRYFEHAVGQGYSRQNLVNALLAEAPRPPSARDAAERLRVLEQDFSVVLAVTMGIYSVGIDRLKEVIKYRLSSAPADDTLQDAWSNVDDSDLMTVIQTTLVDDLRRLLEKGNIDEADFARRKRTVETDATVISRLIRMNSRESAGLHRSKGSRDSKDVFLYVSSAPRSRRIFGLPAIANAQPEINRRPFNMWRTRAQLFIYSLHNVTYNSYDRSLHPIDYLTRLKPIVAETARFPHMHQCRNCVLYGGDGDRGCNLIKLCDMISSLDYGIVKARKSMRNLSLVKSLENYRRFKDAKPKNREETAYVKFFKELFEGRVHGAVLERIRELQRMVLIKWEFSENMPAMYDYAYGRDLIKKTHVDDVTNPIQALPIYLKLASKDHRSIVDAVVRFHKTPDVSSADALDVAYKTFVDSDKKESSLRFEHEIVRCLLYMGCIGISNTHLLRVSGNELALRHARTIEPESSEAGTSDLWYIMAWAMRRSGTYSEADALLNKAIRKYPADPRMWHGRMLNAFSWFQDREKLPFPHKLSRAVRDATKAVMLYQSDGAVEQCAVNLNNIAYLRSFIQSNPVFNLRAARVALDRMKIVLPREKWFPSYPEFFHTEANLEYQEYSAAAVKPRSKLDLVEKLANALKVIAKALEVEKKPSYEALRDKIERAIEFERERALTPKTAAFGRTKRERSGGP
jgi:hypothetical protein